MNQTTGKQYMLSALKRKQLDRVPATVLIGPYCARLTQYSVREILTDARKSAEAHLAFHNRFNPDSLVVYNDKKFIKPYHQELCSYFQLKKRFMSLHICGKIDPIMEDIIETGIFLLSLDAGSSLQKLTQTAQNNLVIMGNVPTTHFSSGSREEMEASIRQCIDTAAADSGYILASGCEIPFDSTEDRIDHFFEYSRQYGREFMERIGSDVPGS